MLLVHFVAQQHRDATLTVATNTGFPHLLANFCKTSAFLILPQVPVAQAKSQELQTKGGCSLVL